MAKDILQRVGWAVTHPLSAATAVFTFLTGLLTPEGAWAVFQTVIASAGEAFRLLTLGAVTLTQFWPPTTLLDRVILSVGVIFAAGILDKLIMRYRARREASES